MLADVLKGVLLATTISEGNTFGGQIEHGQWAQLASDCGYCDQSHLIIIFNTFRVESHVVRASEGCAFKGRNRPPHRIGHFSKTEKPSELDNDYRIAVLRILFDSLYSS